jgi:EAL and modified HD-GYP domain-containing signal transduction protein
VEATVLRFRAEDLDDALLERMEHLADLGYLIALDSRPAEKWVNRARGVVDCVRIDLSQLSREESTAEAEELSGYGIRLIAVGVDDRWAFEFARDIGCHYFQGYFFCRPDLDGRNPTRHNQVRLMTLLKRLQDPDLDFPDVEDIIKQDVALSYRLIRCLNSAAFAMATRVTSVGHALVLLGMDNLRKWLTVFALSGVEGKPPELIRTALQRAKMCELLGKILRHPSPEILFTVGLFSVLDGLLDRRMEEAVAGLPLAPEVVRALVDHDGFEGSVLKVVEAYEAGRWDDVVFPGLGANIVSGAWLDTIRWTASLPL